MAQLGTKLFVGCLPYSKSEGDLRPIFQQCGPIAEIALLKKPDGSSKGAAFVTYQSPQSASMALISLQGYTFEGSNRGLNITMAGSNGMGGGNNMGGGGFFGGVGMGAGVNAFGCFGKGGGNFGGNFGGKGGGNFGGKGGKGGGNFGGKGGSMVPQMPGTKVFVGQLPYSK